METFFNAFQFLKSYLTWNINQFINDTHLNLLIIGIWNDFINLSGPLKNTGFWMKTFNLVSVDLTELYFGKFNFIRYCFGWIHLMIMYICLFGSILIVSNDWLFSMTDNEFFPENAKMINVLLNLWTIGAISIRLDILLAERSGNISLFKDFYYLQEGIQSKHGLTPENHRKFSILCKILFLIAFFGLLIMVLIACASQLLIVITSERTLILYTLLLPFVFYIIIMTITTLGIMASIGIGLMYYYILKLKQINHEFDLICQKSNLFITINDQEKLISLIDKHNSIASQISKLNMMSRRSILVFYVGFSLNLIIPMNIYLNTENISEKLFCLAFIICTFSHGVCFAYAMSSVNKIAHKPYKTIYQILTKQNFTNFYSKRNFHYKWKVIH